ncbi:MAG: hypothetical protein WCT49_05260 [Candidatus Paceibacterota bacterium]|jgi:hypothetical protein|nr:hypothetical protein [Candidatus Paceibacterota bacterium]
MVPNFHSEAYRSEIHEMKDVPPEAQEILDRILVHDHNHTPGVTATPEDIAIVKEAFSEGIRIEGKLYEIKVFQPNDEHGRPYFILREKHLDGVERSLDETDLKDNAYVEEKRELGERIPTEERKNPFFESEADLEEMRKLLKIKKDWEEMDKPEKEAA